MRKKLLALFMAIAVMCSTAHIAQVRAVSFAAAEPQLIVYIVDPRASEYLERYTIQLQAEGKGRMSVDMTVDGTGPMSRIGVMDLYIEEKNTSSGTWHELKTMYGEDNESLFYDFKSQDYMRTIYFDGTPGRYYRVTMTAHAAIDKVGFDTGTLTSSTVRCT